MGDPSKKPSYFSFVWLGLALLLALAESVQQKQYWIFIPLVGVGIFFWFAATAPERSRRRALREQEARNKAEETVQGYERNIELLKQNKENEYTSRRQLRAEIERMPKYSNWRSAIFQRYGRRCEMCGATGELEIHHRASFDALLRSCHITTIEAAFECNTLWDIDNGSVLCKGCHSKMESSKYRELKKPR